MVDPTSRMSVFLKLNLEPIASEVADNSDLIRARSSSLDRNKLVSLAYIISLAGGSESTEIP